MPAKPAPAASPKYSEAMTREITGSTLSLMISAIAGRSRWRCAARPRQPPPARPAHCRSHDTGPDQQTGVLGPRHFQTDLRAMTLIAVSLSGHPVPRPDQRQCDEPWATQVVPRRVACRVAHPGAVDVRPVLGNGEHGPAVPRSVIVSWRAAAGPEAYVNAAHTGADRCHRRERVRSASAARAAGKISAGGLTSPAPT